MRLSTGPVSARRKFRSAAAIAVASVAVLVYACSAHPGAHGPGGTPTAAHADPDSTVTPAAGGPGSTMALQVMPAPYQLPAAISREVVLAAGPGGPGGPGGPAGDAVNGANAVNGASGLLIAGGVTAQGATTGAVTRLDPVTGATSSMAGLAAPTHDAAGAALAGRAYVFGGGTAASVPTIQAFAPGSGTAVVGRLATARSDVSGVTAGSVAYLVGGYDGTTLDPAVLATADGTHFRVAARLPVPVRYAGVAAASGAIWVFGGETASGATDAIQRIDPAAGRASVVGHMPQPLQGAAGISLSGLIYVAGGAAPGMTSRTVYRFDPRSSSVTAAGELPVPVAYAGAAVTGNVGYLIGGEDGTRPVPSVTTLRLVPAGQVIPAAGVTPWLAPPTGPGHLAPGSDPSVLPGAVLIADHMNNRLLIVDPQGRIRWEFPRPGDLAPGQTFPVPDDAFFSADGKLIIATQEDNQVISVISVATRRIIYRYGVPGQPGPGPGHLSNPDDAMLTPRGLIISADIRNCRVVVITPPAHIPTRVIGQTTQACQHDPPRRFGSPNGAFPLTNGHYLVTEINGDWANEISLGGAVAWSANPPGVLYPSDTNEVYPGRYLTADYSSPGQIVEFASSGHLLWRRGGFKQPSLALPLPNGDILLNDDFNHRVCVVDPATGRIVWQYGHTGVSGRAPGYLNDPDGVDLVPPDSLVITHAATMGEP